jgi:putative DNA primase/helicase
MPPASRDAIALWIVLTYAVAAVFVLPMLVISSPQKRCGKSTLLIVLHKLCKRALLISNITAPALYRTVETHRPTLLLDEADTWCRENQEMRGVLDCGHTRETAHVLRVDGEKLEPRVFDCFTPKALAGIGSLADTIHDRAIVINLKRRAPGETVQRLRQDRIDLSHLKSMSARWAADHLEQIRHADAAVPQSLNDRASDNWRPLFGIAALAGGAWPARTRQAALELSANDADDDNVNVLLLGDIRTLLTASGGRMASKDLCSALVLLPERPWGEWKHGRPMTMNQLARRLKPFGIESRSIRTGHDVFKGYDLADCIDTFARYLKNGDSSVTPLHRLENKPESADLESYRDSDVTVRTVTRETSVTARNVEFPGKNSVCNDVTAETDKSWDPQEGIEL